LIRKREPNELKIKPTRAANSNAKSRAKLKNLTIRNFLQGANPKFSTSDFAKRK
jgi:hypothetical protein